MIKITIDSQYHRAQFDDWLAGGKFEFKGKRYYWSAQNNNYGFGWEIEPITEEDWSRFDEDEFNELMKIIEKCLLEHKTEYVVS
jgi:YHS domain-containing protein